MVETHSTAGITDHNDVKHYGSAKRGVVGGVATFLHQHLSSYWHGIFSEVTIVQGNWVQNTSSGTSDYDTDLTGSGRKILNGPQAANVNDLDEIHFGDIVLNAGTYKVVVAYLKEGQGGIMEILHGDTSIGTQDIYTSGNPIYDLVVTFNYSPTARVSGNLRVRVNGTSGTNYRIHLSRIEIIRVS